MCFLLDAIVGNDVKYQQTNKNTLNAFSKHSTSTKRSIIEKFKFGWNSPLLKSSNFKRDFDYWKSSNFIETFEF